MNKNFGNSPILMNRQDKYSKKFLRTHIVYNEDRIKKSNFSKDTTLDINETFDLADNLKESLFESHGHVDKEESI